MQILLDLLIIITDLARFKHTSIFQENEGCNIILNLTIKIIYRQKEYSFFISLSGTGNVKYTNPVEGVRFYNEKIFGLKSF